MTHRSELGRLGEDAACGYLVKRGYKIISRNFRQKWGELDIIAISPDKTLVFVEVKTLRQYSGQALQQAQDKQSINQLQPEDNLTQSKLQKLERTASLYASHYPELIKDSKGWRIDLLAITQKGDDFDIRHYENIND